MIITWQNRLDLKDLWRSRKDGESITIQYMAKEIAKRIRKLKCYKEYEDELEEIATNFEFCGEDVEEFDEYLCELYDWGDGEHLCWIATSF